MPEFIEAKDEAVNAKVDFLEEMAQKKAADGDTQMIIFLLKTLGRSRGYTEKAQIENTTNILNVNGSDVQKMTPQKQLEYIRGVA